MTWCPNNRREGFPAVQLLPPKAQTNEQKQQEKQNSLFIQHSIHNVLNNRTFNRAQPAHPLPPRQADQAETVNTLRRFANEPDTGYTCREKKKREPPTGRERAAAHTHAHLPNLYTSNEATTTHACPTRNKAPHKSGIETNAKQAAAARLGDHPYVH